MKTGQTREREDARFAKLIGEVTVIASKVEEKATNRNIRWGYVRGMLAAEGITVQEVTAWVTARMKRRWTSASQGERRGMLRGLQRVVDKPRKFAPELPWGYQKMCRDWDILMPGRGVDIVRMISILYDDRLELVLTPPRRDLRRAARRAIFWQKITGVRIVTLDEFWNIRQEEATLFMHHLPDGTQIQSLDAGLLLGKMYQLPTLKLREQFGLKSVIFSHEQQRQSELDSYLYWVRMTVASIMHSAINSALADGPGKYNPLLELCRSGNIPLGIDAQGNVLVLCTETK